MVKRFVITDPISQIGFLIQIGGCPNDAVREFAKRIGVEPPEGEKYPRGGGRFFNHSTIRAGCIWLREDAGAGTVAHECFHAVYYILGKLDSKLTDDTEEIYAYYLQWFVNEILPNMQAPAKKKRTPQPRARS